MISRYILDPERSCVSVLALSTLHSVLGEGFGLSGSISCTLDDLENDAVCEVSFPMAELSFGDKLRNWQLHRHLDTKQWPQATFSLGVTRVISKSPWKLECSGTLLYRNHKVSITTEVTGEVESDHLRVTAQFPINLSNFGMKPPKFLFLSVADEVYVKVRLYASG